MDIDKSRNDLIIKALEAKNAVHPCSRCGSSRFEIAGESTFPLQDNPGGFLVGGPSIPTAMVACSNCGHVWHHALGVLGLIRGQS